MKKNHSAALMLVMMLLLLCTEALAAASHAGILDFAGRLIGADVPEDAQAYVQTNVANTENELVTVQLRELYYDGYLSRMVVDITPKDPAIMLLGMGVTPEDSWQSMSYSNGEWDSDDDRTIRDVFREKGCRAAYTVESWLEPEGDESTGISCDYYLDDDGTLTLYTQVEYADVQPQRTVLFRVNLTPYGYPFTSGISLFSNASSMLETSITLEQADYAYETFVSTEAMDYPSVGVRVDEIRLEVRAQEIHAFIDYTITDRAAYNAFGDGLWFELIDPESTADQPYRQRLKSGLTGSGSNGPVDGLELADAVHFRQNEALGRSELHDTYTLRAYDCWEEERFETRTFTMQKAN